MNLKELSKLKSHLSAALACIEALGGEENEPADDEKETIGDTAPEEDGADDDMALKSMAMKLRKYKE